MAASAYAHEIDRKYAPAEHQQAAATFADEISEHPQLLRRERFGRTEDHMSRVVNDNVEPLVFANDVLDCCIGRRLRSNVEDRLRYETLKRRLAREDWPDMNAYARAKTEVGRPGPFPLIAPTTVLQLIATADE